MDGRNRRNAGNAGGDDDDNENIDWDQDVGIGAGGDVDGGNANEDMADDDANNNDDDDDDDDGENDDDNPAEPQDEDRIPRNADGTFDGGSSADGKATTAACDLTLFLECVESLKEHPDHPILTPRATVAIGLDKSTKLGSVFACYINFCNQHKSSPESPILTLKELEFVHCTVLEGGDTAEVSALMKNDRIRVQSIRHADLRDAQKQLRKLQRESDQHYFEQLRNLMPDHKIGGLCCDVLLDCRGKLVDENGMNQEVLRTELRGHSHILAKRCTWLKRTIRQARDELERKSVVSIPDIETAAAATGGLKGHSSSPRSPGNSSSLSRAVAATESDEDGIVMPYHAVQGNEQAVGAAQIENDDDEEGQQPSINLNCSGSPIISSNRNLLWVTIPHPPAAVSLLLEYCYTNRVISLGREAFEGTSYPAPHEEGAPAYPLEPQWPDKDGKPKVSFGVVLAGITIAEEADMKRLSLMCEIAASELVGNSNVVAALNMCAAQEKRTGNCLPRLRKAAMAQVLRNGVRGVSIMFRTQGFQRALKESSAALVPSLLQGAADILSSSDDRKSNNKNKQDVITPLDNFELQEYFHKIDAQDMYDREQERRRYRAEKRKVPIDDLDDNLSISTEWAVGPPVKKVRRSASGKSSTKHSKHYHRRSSKHGDKSGRRKGRFSG